MKYNIYYKVKEKSLHAKWNEHNKVLDFKDKLWDYRKVPKMLGVDIKTHKLVIVSILDKYE